MVRLIRIVHPDVTVWLFDLNALSKQVLDNLKAEGLLLSFRSKRLLVSSPPSKFQRPYVYDECRYLQVSSS